MFWSSATNNSNIEAVLDQPDVTLLNILDQEEVLQECRSGNKKLLEYLLRVENMDLMLDIITIEPSADTSLALQYKHPNIICEILTSDISFTEKIAGSNHFLEKLFHYFRDTSPPLNPLLGSYICRVLGETVGRKLDQNWYSYQLNVIQIMGYLQTEANLIEWLLCHLGTSAVCDFITKLIINMEGPDMRANLFQWLIEKENFIIRLMEKMNNRETDRDVHANISRLVGDLLFAFRDDMSSANEADPFLEALRSPSTIAALNKAIFDVKDGDNELSIKESTIIHGLDIILSLLGITKKPPKQPSRRDSLDETHRIKIPVEIVNELTSHFDDLRALLCNPPDLESIKLTYGLVEEPLGSIRLAIAKYFAHISTLRWNQLITYAAKSRVLNELMEIFWEYPWNNFLHRYVSKFLVHIVSDESPSIEALNYLIHDHDLLEKIISTFDLKIKCGYRGHLARVAATIVECSSVDGPLSQVIAMLPAEKQESWEAFIYDTFDRYQHDQNILLAGAHPPSSGNHLSTPGLTYDSDPGMQWGGLSGVASAGLSPSELVGDTFSSDRFDDEKSKTLFEMFCADKSSYSLDDGWGDGDEDLQDSNDINSENAAGLSSVDRFDLEKSKNLFDMFCDEKVSTLDTWEDYSDAQEPPNEEELRLFNSCQQELALCKGDGPSVVSSKKKCKETAKPESGAGDAVNYEPPNSVKNKWGGDWRDNQNHQSPDDLVAADWTTGGEINEKTAISFWGGDSTKDWRDSANGGKDDEEDDQIGVKQWKPPQEYAGDEENVVEPVESQEPYTPEFSIIKAGVDPWAYIEPPPVSPPNDSDEKWADFDSFKEGTDKPEVKPIKEEEEPKSPVVLTAACNSSDVSVEFDSGKEEVVNDVASN